MNGTISEAVKSQMWHITFLHYHYLIDLSESTSKSEVQRKGQILESTMKNFGVNAKVKQIKIGPLHNMKSNPKGLRLVKLLICIMILHSLWRKDVRIEAPIPGRSLV